MARFQIEKLEGMQWVKVTLSDEAVRAERGAFSHMRGNLTMDLPLPSPREMLISAFSVESMLRPRYRGTGELYLESSLGTFHALRVNKGETWIIEDGAYWASEEGIRISYHREKSMTSLWAGEGMFWYQTKVTGQGQVVLVASGKAEEVVLNNEELVADGKYVVARTSGISLKIRRPGRGLMGYFFSGERSARSYKGTGRLLIVTTPNWRLRVSQSKDSGDPSMAKVSK
jgi:uncharacterized protein (AIM24 family)